MKVAQDGLFDAIREADLERVKLCLENGAQINSKGCHIKNCKRNHGHIKTLPLHYATSNCERNHDDVIKILPQNGAFVNLKKQSWTQKRCSTLKS